MRFSIQAIQERAKRLTVLGTYIKRVPAYARKLPLMLWEGFVWNVIPKRRKVQAQAVLLEPIPDAPEVLQHLRLEIYRRCLLEVKDQELRLELGLMLQQSPKPAGPEQIFLMVIYPLLLHRRLIAIPRPSGPGRLDIEVGYKAHAEEYYFWDMEIDGRARERADRTPTPRRRSRDDRIYQSYAIPAAGLIDLETADLTEITIRIRSYFINILEDLKRRGYRLLTAQVPSHEALTYSQRKQANSRVTSPFIPRRRSRR